MKRCPRPAPTPSSRIFVAAAILTPTPDVFTLMLMAAPMIILYEICIWLAYFDRKKNRIQEEQEARESDGAPASPRGTNARRGSRRRTDHPEDRRLASTNASDTHRSPPHEAGDDGWHDEYPQQDHHASDEIPELDETPPENKPAEERNEPTRTPDSDFLIR